MGRPKSFEVEVQTPIGPIKTKGHLCNSKVDQCSGGSYEIEILNIEGARNVGLVGSREQSGRMLWRNNVSEYDYVSRASATRDVVMASLAATLAVQLNQIIKTYELRKLEEQKAEQDKNLIVVPK